MLFQEKSMKCPELFGVIVLDIFLKTYLLVTFGKNVFTDIWSSLTALQEDYVELKD